LKQKEENDILVKNNEILRIELEEKKKILDESDNKLNDFEIEIKNLNKKIEEKKKEFEDLEKKKQEIEEKQTNNINEQDKNEEKGEKKNSSNIDLKLLKEKLLQSRKDLDFSISLACEKAEQKLAIKRFGDISAKSILEFKEPNPLKIGQLQKEGKQPQNWRKRIFI
jgi:predicted RNase H-like nuclease (RuvC/YqgF family)